ncbi:adenylate/guanylate cyclase domain-containing protein [Myxococcaceae bacterium GXIMD 01537]
MWQIIINGPGYFDTAYDLPEGVTTLGRADDNDIVLGGDLVSRKHARLVVDGDALRLEDLGSRNGTRLNGAPLQGAKALNPGDAIILGENTLAVRQPQTVENATTEMVDLDGGGGIRRFGHGDELGSSVILAKNVRDADILAALDNFGPISFDESFAQSAPVAATAGSRVAYETLFLLFRTAEALATASTLATFLDATMDRVIEATDATTAVVLLRHSSGALVPSAVRHRGKLARGEVPVSDAVVEEALRKGRALAVADVRDDRRFAGRESVMLYGVDRVLCIPVGVEPPFTGVLYVNTSAKSETNLEMMLDACSAVSHLVHSGVQKFSAKQAGNSTVDRLRRTLERFHTPEVSERRAAEAQRAGGKLPALEEKPLTVLHAELVGFGPLATKLGAARATQILNDFHARMSGLIYSFEGSVEGFLGESLRALFGAPYGKGDDPVRAVRAGLALRSDWERAMARRPNEERCELKVGIHTTKALVGLVGTEARQHYSAVGEGVNIATLLAGTAMPGQVLITGKTLAAVGVRFDVMPLGERVLRTPKDKVATFEVIDEDVPQLTNPGVR